MTTTTPYPAADLLPRGLQDVLARYPLTTCWLLLAVGLEACVQTVIR